MRLQAALTGNLKKAMEEELERGAKAVTQGTHRAIEALKSRQRRKTIEAFGSQRLANAWRSKIYPRPPAASLGAAGTVFSNAPHIIEAFASGSVIRSKDGFFLAIPSPDAPRQYLGKPVSPSNWPAERFGDLKFVYRAGKSSLLVVDGVRRNASGSVGKRLKNGGVTARGGYRRGVVSVVMFFLVPQVRFRKVFDLDADYLAAGDDMVAQILQAWEA